VGLANYLSFRHFTRYQWSADARYSLSPETRRVLGAVTNDIRVSVLFSRNHELFGPVTGLLQEYAYACPHLQVDAVDYNRDPGRAELLAARYQLPGEDDDAVVFDAQGRVKVVRATELSDYDLAAILAGEGETRRLNFKGEPLFTSAIAGLLQDHQPVACFLQGHGEHDPTSEDDIRGYSRFAGMLRNKNIAVRKLTLLGEDAVPDDCALLIVAGPRSRLDGSELQKIDRFLGQGGRVLALLSFYESKRSETGMERFLLNWGIAAGADYVLDPPNSPQGYDIICTNFSSHPIVKPLQDQRIYLLWPRSITPGVIPGASGDAPRVQPLVATGLNGYTASAVSSNGTPERDPMRDRSGAIPLAAAVERGSLAGVSADRFSSRMVVVGDSFILGNETIVKAANWEFASLAVNWLLDRPEHLAGIAPKPIREYAVSLTRNQLIRLTWILLGLVPGAVFALGLLIWMRRKA
ncbi:MAG: Gldg family protein, partial [Verrucomicrobiae bacterium]|nr:Gldg family protein [Verrucomicrobiae bacterium]